MYEHDDGPFTRLLDIDPHEHIGLLEKQIEGVEPDRLLTKGIEALDSDSLLALVCLERASITLNTPELASALGFCLAKERTQFLKAVELCRSAIELDKHNPVHYLRLGRVYLMQGKKTEAIGVYHDGLREGDNPDIRADLALVGSRRRPVIPALHREHFLNRSLGIILKKFFPKRNI